MQEQVDDQGLAGLARARVPAARPVASADPTVLGPAPAALDCPYLHLDDDGPSCLALPPAIRLSRRQVEIVCAVAAHVACPRLIKADAGRVPVAVDPPARVVRRDRPSAAAAADGVAAPAAAMGLAASLEPAMGEAVAMPAHAAATQPAAPAGGTAATAAIPDTAPPRTDPVIRATAPAAPPAAPSIPGRATTPPAEPAEPAVPATPTATERVGIALALARVTAQRHITLRPVTAAAWLILVGTLIVVIALLNARGGLTLPSLAPSSAGLAGAIASAAPTPAPTAVPSSPSASPSASLPPSASPSPSTGASPSPSASASGSSPFSAEQLAVLKPCPGKPDCYQYRIKSGDNLRNIATFFGVTYPALLAANPQITNPSIIHVGQQVIVPYPKAPKASPTPKP